MRALDFSRNVSTSKDQAEAVSEAIIQHADLGGTDMLTSLGILIQLSTVFGKSTFTFLRIYDPETEILCTAWSCAAIV